MSDDARTHADDRDGSLAGDATLRRQRALSDLSRLALEQVTVPGTGRSNADFLGTVAERVAEVLAVDVVYAYERAGGGHLRHVAGTGPVDPDDAASADEPGETVRPAEIDVDEWPDGDEVMTLPTSDDRSSCVAIGIEAGGQRWGALVVGSDASSLVDGDRRFLRDVADVVGRALSGTDESSVGASTEGQRGGGVDDRYRMLVEQSLVGISLIQDGRFVFVNPRMEEILGRSREVLLELDPEELIDPTDREIAHERVGRLLDGASEEATFTTEVPHADGGPRYVDVHMKQTEYDGEPALLGVTADVTERARAERARETSEQLFRAVFENAMDGIVIADDDGVVVDANSAARDVFGVEHPELLGRSLDELDPVELDFEGPWGIFRDAGADRGVFRVVRPDGEERVVEYATTADILPERHLSVLRDVTDRRRQEEALAEERERLDFMNALLRHHVLNGMNIIIGLATHLEADAEGREAERLETIAGRGEAIVELIETMRSIIRSIRGQEAPGFDTVDVVDVLEEAVENVGAAHPDVEIHLDDLPESLPVYADDMLATVFDNLLDNAIRHNDVSEPAVEVWVEVDDEVVSVHVADDGPGVPESVREELFEEGTASSSGGFGLNIVHLLVTLYDGAMEIADREPSGTIVTVSLLRA